MGAAAALLTVAVLLALPDAAAGAPGFDIRACGAAPTYGYDSSAFASATSSGRMVARRACNPNTRGLLGLISANRVSRGKARYGEHSTFVLAAPPGTVLTRLTWRGRTGRSNCSWALELYAKRPGARPIHVVNQPATRRCPPRARLSTTGFGPAVNRSLGSSTQLVQRVVCRIRSGCPTSGLNVIRTLSAEVRVTDVTRPSISVAHSGLFGGMWVRGLQSVRLAASDNVGIQSTGLFAGGRWWSAKPNACVFSRSIPCPNGWVNLEYPTTWLPDGSYLVRVRAVDSAGNARDVMARTYVDNHPPDRVSASSHEAGTWKRANAFSLNWPATPERYAPIVAAHVKLCRSGVPSACVTRRYVGGGISSVPQVAVPGPGAWDAVIWREDSAGNASEGQASVPVPLRFDPDPPRVAFETPSISDRDP